MDSKEYIVKEDPLICAICLELWIGNCPRVLSCQHTFCQDCLKTTVANGCIRCPSCRSITHLPNRLVTDLPKNIFDSKISVNQIRICDKHYQKLVEPKFVCITCKVENLCEDCINYSHSGNLCEIKSYDCMKKSNEEFKEKCQTRIDQWVVSIKNEVDYLQKKLFQLEKLWQNTIQEKLTKLRNKIDNYEEKKFHMLEEISEKIENTFFTQDQWEDNIKNIFKTILVDNNDINLELNYDIEEKELNNFQIIKNFKDHFSDSPFDSCFSFTEDGIYRLNPNINPMKIIFLSNLKNDKSYEILLDKCIFDFVITDNYIYGLEKDSGYLYNSIKPFNENINFNIIFNEKSDSLMVNEDYDNNRNIICKNGSLIKFFTNDQFKWEKELPLSSSSSITDICILKNGNSIFATTDLLYFLDKNNGNILQKIQTDTSLPISICPHPISGYYQVNLNESLIRYFDDNLELKNIYFIGYNLWCLRVTNCKKFFILNNLFITSNIFFQFDMFD